MNLLATGVVGAINMVATVPAILFIDRLGRRKVLLMGAVGMVIAHVVVATVSGLYEDSWPQHRAAGWVGAGFIYFFIFNFAYSIACVGWILPSEILPPGARSQGVGIAVSANWMTAFIVGQVTPKMLANIKFGTYIFFAACTLGLIIWVYFFLPETRQVSIEEMDKIWGGTEGRDDMVLINQLDAKYGLTSEKIGGEGHLTGDKSSYAGDTIHVERQASY